MERSDWETNWQPLMPGQVAEMFRKHSGHWWIAGGWALDIFAGGEPRSHADIDIAVLRDELPHVFETLSGWQLWGCQWPGKDVLHLWEPGEPLPPEVHDIWIRPHTDAPWALQLMVYDHNGPEWVYRRDPRLTGLIAELGWLNDDMPILNPEVQLLFKSKNPRPKDVRDFERALPLLSGNQRRWLREALELTDASNAWIDRLKQRI